MKDDGVPDAEAERLQSGLDWLNKANPPEYFAGTLGANFRHLCLKARQAKLTGKGVSTAIDLKERYVTSWRPMGAVVIPVEAEENAAYAILYREGVCKSCRSIARSGEGRVVSTSTRPPLQGRVARD